METYNALIGTKVKEMTIQEMFNTAYDIASREGRSGLTLFVRKLLAVFSPPPPVLKFQH